jgi:DNA-binding transcriptional ArsR family regulator
VVAALDARVGAAARKLTLIALADRAGDDGVCWPSVAKIAHDTELSESTVRRALRELCELGLIEVQRRRVDGASMTNAYRLLITPARGGGYHHDTPPCHCDRGVLSW